MMARLQREIFELATEFRYGIDVAKEKGLFTHKVPFNRFPKGCCGDTSELLAQYLLEHGIETEYVAGAYRDDNPELFQSHAWLARTDGIIIDITGDQFKTNSSFHFYDNPCYVGYMDSFHEMFEIEPRQCYWFKGIDNLGTDSIYRMKNLYQTILQCVSKV